MAQRRMFSPDIVESDEFLDMPDSSQALYFHLVMRADDDGFVQPKSVMKLLGSNSDDLKVLISKRFVLPFETGVVVVKHWLIHNMIRADRYKPTRFIEEKKTLFIKENKAYTDNSDNGKPLLATKWQPNDNQPTPQVRLGKVRLDKNNAPPKGDIVDNLLKEGDKIQHEYQYLGLEVYEKANAPLKKKAECIRLAREYPKLIQPALSFCLDYPNPKLKWKMFLWKLNQLRNEKNTKN